MKLIMRLNLIAVVVIVLIGVNFSFKSINYRQANIRTPTKQFLSQSTIWTPNSWRNYPNPQDIVYPNEDKLKEVLLMLEQSHPLVQYEDIHSLQTRLAQVCDGDGFVLMGGDCSESFSEFGYDKVKDIYVLLQQMALILNAGQTLESIIPIGKIIVCSND